MFCCSTPCIKKKGQYVQSFPLYLVTEYLLFMFQPHFTFLTFASSVRSTKCKVTKKKMSAPNN